MVKDRLKKLWNKLLDWYAEENISEAVVAFSGGKDSTLVLISAMEVLEDIKAVIVDAEVYPEKEIENAVSLAERLGVNYEVIQTCKLEDERFASNPENKCYYCKKQMFDLLEDEGKILEGTNASEVKGHRPGFEAVKEHARAPLYELGIEEEDVRGILEWIGIEVWDKPSFACLATRFPTGERLTEEKLDRVERVEDGIFSFGVKQLRVRDFGNTARIEVWPEDMMVILENREKIIKSLKDEGYENIFLDLEGYRTGSISK
ncbi:MAG: ATP-dependent sacrificial sulfur transferase LarE [Thermoplasmata archaeon]